MRRLNPVQSGACVAASVAAAALVALAPPLAAAPSDSVSMPFTCSAIGPRVVVAPSPPTSYPIVGRREERPITTCASGLQSSCRTLMAHRFTISCGGKRVAWFQVVAAARKSASRPLWIDSGRIHLAVDRPADRRDPCAGGPRGSVARPDRDGGSRFGLPLVECLPWAKRKAPHHVVLPAGFAPVGEIGARIEIGGPELATSSPAAGDKREAQLRGPVASDVAPSVATPTARLEQTALRGLATPPAVRSEPLPEVEPVPVILTGADPSRTWVTRVRPELPAEPASLTAPTPLVAWLLAAMLASLLAAFALAARRWDGVSLAIARSSIAAWRLRERLNLRALGLSRAGAGPANDTSIVNAAASVTALIEQAQGSLATLAGAAPLREVLEHELGGVRQRLAIVKAQASEGPEAAAKAAPGFRALVRDLERVRRIADSAAMSLSDDRQAVHNRVPRTRSEAFDVLGVNADVEEATLKRLVDALRMCWHPDLAKDETDRLLREERIKVINVAWELIVGKRGPG